ncbi:hypothetical protein [Paenibacillus terrigena]|uniref:hypothetical protein n=1 Tax=Paenibacillus terrigena TaxID=369333 RepID=UPI0003A195C9|nr:hypothetical protein [Paenibacillus terrigena]
MRAFNAELSKLFSLPGIWLAFLIGAFAPAVVAALDCIAEKKDIIAGVSTRLSEVGYIGLGFGVQGVIILGVLAVSSEYLTESSESGGGQQITTNKFNCCFISISFFAGKSRRCDSDQHTALYRCYYDNGVNNASYS